jgi:hypothetical protein
MLPIYFRYWLNCHHQKGTIKSKLTCHTIGMIEKALGCSSFCGTNSATVVRMVPTLPLAKPPKARASRAASRVFEKPNRRLEVMVQTRPAKMVGLRPKRSAALPHRMPVSDCDSEKMADVVPAHWAILSVGTSNDSIISGRYGKTEVNAIGSAKRQIATLAKSGSSLLVGEGNDSISRCCGLQLTEDEELLLGQLGRCSSHDVDSCATLIAR